MQSLLPLAPFLIPLFAGALALAFPLTTRKWITILGAILSFVFSLNMLYQITNHATDLFVYKLGGWQSPYGISLTADSFSAFVLCVAQFIMLMGFVYSVGSKEKAVKSAYYYCFFSFLMAGVSGAILTADFFNFFVMSELVVISGAALCSLSDKDLGYEASFKYVLISGLATLFLLVACGLIYVATSSLNVSGVLLATSSIESHQSMLLFWGLFVYLCALLVKSAVFPFHFWQPDFHSAAPTAVSAVLSSVVVKMGLVMFYRIFHYGHSDLLVSIKPIFAILFAVSAAIGALGALGSENIKRIFAYSTMSQMAFILLCLLLPDASALKAAMYFILSHAFLKAALLMLAGALSSRSPLKTLELSKLESFGTPLLGFSALYFFGLSGLAGLPPSSGFVSKFYAFKELLSNSSFSSLSFIYTFVLVVLFCASFLSLLYSFRTFLKIFRSPKALSLSPLPKGDSLWAPSLLVALTLVLGLYPKLLLVPLEVLSAAASNSAVFHKGSASEVFVR